MGQIYSHIAPCHIGAGLIAPCHIGAGLIAPCHIGTGLIAPCHIGAGLIAPCHIGAGLIAPCHIGAGLIALYHIAAGRITSLLKKKHFKYPRCIYRLEIKDTYFVPVVFILIGLSRYYIDVLATVMKMTEQPLSPYCDLRY